MPLSITWAFPSVGVTMLPACLDSALAGGAPDEVLVVLDMEARAMGDPGRLCAEGELPRSHARVLSHREHPWGGINAVAGRAVREARGDWVMPPHDDMLFPRWDYAAHQKWALAWLAERRFLVGGKRVVGVMHPTFELDELKEWPPLPGPCGLTRWVRTHATLFERQALLDLWPAVAAAEGVWWELPLRRELVARDWWLLWLRWPFVAHVGKLGRRAYPAEAAARLNPLWGDVRSTERYRERFGVDPERIDQAADFIPVPEAGGLLA